MKERESLRQSIFTASYFIILLWCIKSAEQLFGISLHQFGVHPGELTGLLGIITAPLIHGSYEHLISNSLPLLLLGTALVLGYPKSRYWVVLIVWIASGIGVWLFARESYHFGASGLTHGMFFFLLVASILRRDKRSMALMMIAFFMYGGMVLSILPQQEHISFESHLFGAIAGLVCGFLFYKLDPKPERKVYDWENEEEATDEDDVVGDLWKHQAEFGNTDAKDSDEKCAPNERLH